MSVHYPVLKNKNKVKFFQEFGQNSVVFFLYSFITNTSPPKEVF